MTSGECVGIISLLVKRVVHSSVVFNVTGVQRASHKHVHLLHRPGPPLQWAPVPGLGVRSVSPRGGVWSRSRSRTLPQGTAGGPTASFCSASAHRPYFREFVPRRFPICPHSLHLSTQPTTSALATLGLSSSFLFIHELLMGLQ